MADRDGLIERLQREIYDERPDGPGMRFTQDSPVLPDIWEAYALRREAQVDLILSPFKGENAGSITRDLRLALESFEEARRAEIDRYGSPDGSDDDPLPKRAKPRIAHVPGLIVASVYFDHLVSLILPSTRWWAVRMGQLGRAIEAIQLQEGPDFDAAPVDLPLSWATDYAPLQEYVTRWIDEIWNPEGSRIDRTARYIPYRKPEGAENTPPPYDFLKMIRVVGLIELARRHEGPAGNEYVPAARIMGAFNSLFRFRVRRLTTQNSLWGASRNRPAQQTMIQSAKAMKADAAQRLFQLTGNGQKWAIIDSGIDGAHPAFADWRARNRNALSSNEMARERPDAGPDDRPSRVLRTYDLDGLRELLDTENLTNLRSELASISARADWRDLIHQKTIAAEKSFGEAIDAMKEAQGGRPSVLHNAEVSLRNQRSTRSVALGLRRLVNAAVVRVREDRLRQNLPVEEHHDTLDAGFELSVIDALLDRLRKGLEIDWSAIEVLIEDVHPPAPINNHGTNVAAILGANWRDDVPSGTYGKNETGSYPALPPGEGRDVLTGVCPEIELIDFRVVTETDDGTIAPHDFEVIAAMKMIDHLNRRAEKIAIHGANLSISIEHNVRSFACGRTPICEECERLVASGVVVVAAAGNAGYSDEGAFTDRFYRNASIGDPGNAEGVITVGATHRSKPHEYGVSFFSSRGPTGDGRAKPDLVAPGEKINTAAPGERLSVVDGTSFSAPHVAGGAALLMERYTELIGKPQRIKTILCNSATDLGREKHFQGAGMLDILRALQSL